MEANGRVLFALVELNLENAKFLTYIDKSDLKKELSDRTGLSAWLVSNFGCLTLFSGSNLNVKDVRLLAAAAWPVNNDNFSVFCSISNDINESNESNEPKVQCIIYEPYKSNESHKAYEPYCFDEFYEPTKSNELNEPCKNLKYDIFCESTICRVKLF